MPQAVLLAPDWHLPPVSQQPDEQLVESQVWAVPQTPWEHFCCELQTAHGAPPYPQALSPKPDSQVVPRTPLLQHPEQLAGEQLTGGAESR